ncbi:MAG: hypothetical protein UH542_01035 [Bacteroidales bacterium]|nr:hypothetical protein [Bacteroidales bacterium]
MPKNEDEPLVFVIPPNFVAEGRVFGGKLKSRNVVEAGIFLVLGILLVLNVPLWSLMTRTIICMILFVPPAVVALIGVNDGSLSEFIIDALKFRLSKRKIQYDTSLGIESYQKKC